MPKYRIMLKPDGLCNKTHYSIFHVSLFNIWFLSLALSLSEIPQNLSVGQSQSKDIVASKKGPRKRSHNLTHQRKLLRSSAATGQNLCWNRVCNHVKFIHETGWSRGCPTRIYLQNSFARLNINVSILQQYHTVCISWITTLKIYHLANFIHLE